MLKITIILPNKNSQVRKHLDDYFNRRNIGPNVVVETDPFEFTVQFVHLGQGYVIILYSLPFTCSNLNIKNCFNLGQNLYPSPNAILEVTHTSTTTPILFICTFTGSLTLSHYSPH